MNPDSKEITKVNKRVLIKKFIVTFLPIAVLLGSILFILYRAELSSKRTELEADQKINASQKLEAVASSFKSVVTDLLVLSKQHELLDLICDSEAVHLKDLQNDYMLFSELKGIYDQIRC
jgi:hypothetical protein